MANCKYLKQKINRKLECKKQNKIINIRECSSCPLCEWTTKVHNKSSSTFSKKSPVKSGLKKRTYKQSKKEKQRYSIIYKDLTKCCVEGCLTPYYNVEKNEVYEGAKRSASIKHGFVCPLCKIHHDQFHNDREFALIYKKMFQRKFEETHSREEFLRIIYCNYLK